LKPKENSFCREVRLNNRDRGGGGSLKESSYLSKCVPAGEYIEKKKKEMSVFTPCQLGRQNVITQLLLFSTYSALKKYQMKNLWGNSVGYTERVKYLQAQVPSCSNV
jgi:hypothetical protein